jgi:Uma2 family endonuclease
MAIVRARLTEEEFMRLPDDGRKYELVDGEAKEVPTGYLHELITTRVLELLLPHARGKAYVGGSGAGFRMATRNVRAPDVSVTLKSRLPGGPTVGFWNEAPDLCIEIISPSEDREDMARKMREYFDSGAQEVWQLFPESRTLRRFTSSLDFEELSSETEITLPNLLPTFHARITELFEIE